MEREGQEFQTNTPIGDIFNHNGRKSNASWRWQSDENGKSGQAFYAVKDVAKGEPVNISYGDKSNHFLLNGYGFTLESGANEEPV